MTSLINKSRHHIAKWNKCNDRTIQMVVRRCSIYIQKILEYKYIIFKIRFLYA